ncbi:MAG: DUF3298 and DUF4163 domain-containing protein [Bacillota bacterium]|nr:DUF3298 and DUF4163 domain-containing protein [Bacillota bacterium]
MYCPYSNLYRNSRFSFASTEDLIGEATRMNSPDNPITVVPKEIKSSNEKIRENLRIPVLRGSVKPEVINFINSNMSEDIMEFKRQMEEAADEHAMKAKLAGRPVVPYDISNIYSITYNKNGIISISVIYEEILDGKSYYIRATYNYDTNSGKSLSVLDLFKPGVDAKTLINSEIMRELRANPQNYFPGAIKNFKGIADDQPFYIDNNNLVLFFGFNEIAPVASQIPAISIPLSRFRTALKPQILRSSD